MKNRTKKQAPVNLPIKARTHNACEYAQSIAVTYSPHATTRKTMVVA